ncbi:hypothetical protein BST96_06575 [Oceanicoccus sagamiensis]|uniref:Secretin/TonB short N-terminal domain-containing protein n=2 Tax=Oceanicoccus sagamiensis TaxID=716816 RepID=A0A1X9ND20_9GAMM|nr:hypothetical protein BST96_06575 [Oceanicoccus sagamiensis]
MQAGCLYLLLISVISFAHGAWAEPGRYQSPAAKTAMAQRYQLDIPRASTEQALQALARQTSKQLLFSHRSVDAFTSNALKGHYSLQQALEFILNGTGLIADYTDSGVIVISPRGNNSDANYGDKTMNSKKQLLAATVGFLIGAGGASQSVLAQENSADNQGWVLEEIVVTATKRGDKNLMDVPISVAAFSGEDIENRGIQTIDDLSFAVPNLSATSNGPGRSFYFIRGVGGSNGDSPIVGIYFDEVPVSVGVGDHPDIRATDLEQVEVLRGPQGTLFGQGSVGGTVRFITRDPDFNGFGGSIDLSAYKSKGSGWSEGLTGVLNIPVVDDTLAFRLVASYENNEGWINQIDDDGAIIEENFNSNELSNLRLKGLWQASDNLAFSSMVVKHHNKSDGVNLALNSPDGSFSAPDRVMRSAADPTLPFGLDDEHDIYNITATYDFGSMLLTAVASEIETSNLSKNESIFLTVPDEGVLGIADIDRHRETKTSSQEVRLSSLPDNDYKIDWVLGVFMSDSEITEKTGNSLTDIFGFFVVEDGPTLPEKIGSDSLAFFGDVSYAIDERWTIGAGSRFFKDDRSFVSDLDGKLEETFDKVSSKVYVSFLAAENTNLYFSMSEGFRSGGFNPPSTTFAGANLSYDPEELLTYELGLKASWFENRLATNLAFYFSEYTDFLSGVLAADDSGDSSLQNAGEAEIEGVEWDVRWLATPYLTIGFNGNVTDTEFTSLKEGVEDKVVGDPVDNSPEYSYSLTADYQFNWARDMPGYARFDYNRQGPAFLLIRNSGVIPEVGKSEAVTFLNAHVGMRWASVDVELFGNNLLDEDEGTANFAVTGRDSVLRSRSFGLKVGYDF